MASLTAIRTALAANLASISGLAQSPYMLANPTPPAAEIAPGEIRYDEAFARGLDRWQFKVRVFVGMTSDIGAQKRLDSMLASSGAGSIKAALESDRTLGGACEDLHVTGCRGYMVFTREGGNAVLGTEFDVVVLATG